MSVYPGTRQNLVSRAGARDPATLHLIEQFVWLHLPQEVQQISQACGELALEMLMRLPDGPELTAGLRKLLEAKDCFVRQAFEVRLDPAD